MWKAASVLGVSLALGVAAPVAAQDLDGKWEGTTTMNGQRVEVALAFSEVAGRTVGTVSLTGLNGDHELFIVHYDAPVLHLETAADRALLVFDGETRGDTMHGWIERDGAKARVELTRTARVNGR